jgi:glycosyltransferase involved in cell wall biosynthesis
MLKCLSRKHEVHFVAFEDREHPEALERAPEYCYKAYPVPHEAPDKRSPAFALQLLGSLIDPMPLAVSRWRSEAVRAQVSRLLAQYDFDCVVCDFLVMAPNMPDWRGTVLFQHNVEAAIWERHRDTQTSVIRRWYFGLQAQKMLSYEAEACHQAQWVIAVSEADEIRFRAGYGVGKVSHVPTGVNMDFFRKPNEFPGQPYDLVFVGSMDWMPNTDGMGWFLREVLPLIRRERPGTGVAIVGRKASGAIQAQAAEIGNVEVTGTVPDVRPYLWGGAVSIVPLRIGGGTRIKIYEAVAAEIPVVSTTIGAEGLDLAVPNQIRIGDTPEAFAQECLELLAKPEARARQARDAKEYVAARYTWEAVAAQFEEILAANGRHATPAAVEKSASAAD